MVASHDGRVSSLGWSAAQMFMGGLDGWLGGRLDRPGRRSLATRLEVRNRKLWITRTRGVRIRWNLLPASQNPGNLDRVPASRPSPATWRISDAPPHPEDRAHA